MQHSRRYALSSGGRCRCLTVWRTGWLSPPSLHSPASALRTRTRAFIWYDTIHACVLWKLVCSFMFYLSDVIMLATIIINTVYHEDCKIGFKIFIYRYLLNRIFWSHLRLRWTWRKYSSERIFSATSSAHRHLQDTSTYRPLCGWRRIMNGLVAGLYMASLCM